MASSWESPPFTGTQPKSTLALPVSLDVARRTLYGGLSSLQEARRLAASY